MAVYFMRKRNYRALQYQLAKSAELNNAKIVGELKKASANEEVATNVTTTVSVQRLVCY